MPFTRWSDDSDRKPHPKQLSEITTLAHDKSETIITPFSPDAINTATLNESSQPSSQNVTASGLEAKIDKLVDVMTQFISFQMQSAIQPPTTPPTKAKVRATEEVKPTTITNEVAASKANSSDATTQQRSKRNSPEAEGAISKRSA